MTEWKCDHCSDFPGVGVRTDRPAVELQRRCCMRMLRLCVSCAPAFAHPLGIACKPCWEARR